MIALVWALLIVVLRFQDLLGQQEFPLPQVLDDLKLHDPVVHGQGVYCDVVGVGGDQGLHGGRHVRVHLKELSTEKKQVSSSLIPELVFNTLARSHDTRGKCGNDSKYLREEMYF